MACFCRQELDFALALLGRMRLQVRQIHPDTPLSACDGGLRNMLGMEEHTTSGMTAHRFQECTVYKMVDSFGCRYIYFRLPQTEPPEMLMLGPYLTADLSHEDLLELAEQVRIPVSYLSHLANYFAALPVYHDPAAIFAVVYTLGEALWGGGDFETVDIDAGSYSHERSAVSVNIPIEQENILQQMQQMEDRYAYENKLMDIVANGMIHQAEGLLSSISRLNFQPRVADPLRNQKNYCIICNTLLRKAAQQGGVHPFYIDKMSSQFARTIENASTLEKCSALLGEMVAAYCSLVHEHTREKYSPAVQKVISYIDANLSGDLSLTTLAHLIQVTPSYLSTLFHRETKRTLADYITSSRMQAALQLLKTTHLQIQTVAQLCGFSDPNYFSKKFRRYYGVMPSQYLQNRQAGSPGTGEEYKGIFPDG